MVATSSENPSSVSDGDTIGFAVSDSDSVGSASSSVISLLDRLKSPAAADIARNVAAQKAPTVRVLSRMLCEIFDDIFCGNLLVQ